MKRIFCTLLFVLWGALPIFANNTFLYEMKGEILLDLGDGSPKVIPSTLNMTLDVNDALSGSITITDINVYYKDQRHTAEGPFTGTTLPYSDRSFWASIDAELPFLGVLVPLTILSNNTVTDSFSALETTMTFEIKDGPYKGFSDKLTATFHGER